MRFIVRQLFDLKKGTEDAKHIYYNAAGLRVTDEIAANTNVRTGLLRNSMTYTLSDGMSGEFGAVVGASGSTSLSLPDDRFKLRPPPGDKVKIGSAVNYAAPYEKRFGNISNGFDNTVSDHPELLKKSFVKAGF